MDGRMGRRGDQRRRHSGRRGKLKIGGDGGGGGGGRRKEEMGESEPEGY